MEGEKAIEIRGLHFFLSGWELPHCAVSTLRLQAGESLGLIGCNGAGKSTLLLHLNGILRGSTPVRILGDEISGIRRLSRIRARVGMIFQDPDNQLFMPTVSDDVGFGPVNMGMPGRSGPGSVPAPCPRWTCLASKSVPLTT